MADRKSGAFDHVDMAAPAGDRVMPLFSLKGRTAIVSGAGAGIGLAVAQALAEAGANVAIWYNSNKQAVAEAANMEKTFGVKCRAYQVNVVSAADVERAINDIVNEFNGRLDVFVANSGIGWPDGPFLDGEPEMAKKVMTVNVDGDVCMAGKSLAVEWTGFARVNTVSPGYIATDMLNYADPHMVQLWNEKTVMGRQGSVNELKGSYLYLASDASSYTTGHDLIVDGGYTVP
ncbi:hypothetical protein CDD83_8376 [Cordyceps sp. RAO-2017]|nr:hypothetical protein CDD83_8376 [Cordyceps sp. RAO-2017]